MTAAANPAGQIPATEYQRLTAARDQVNDVLMTIDAELAQSSRFKTAHSAAIVGFDHLANLSRKLTGAWDALREIAAEVEKSDRMRVWRAALAQADARATLDEMERSNRERESFAAQESLQLVPRQSAPAFANKAGAR